MTSRGGSLLFFLGMDRGRAAALLECAFDVKVVLVLRPFFYCFPLYVCVLWRRSSLSIIIGGVPLD